ncbi:MAG TPA: hypothetical protein VER78_02295 [Thermoanaerobaculia bacterium]|nr:hypothetical protein [Thermoanaerobaculia bacterium]
MALVIGLMTRFFVSQHRVRRELYRLAGEVGWTERKRPWLTPRRTVAGLWNGRLVAIQYVPPGKGTPAFLSTEIELPLSGRFELRCRPAKGSFWNRPLSFFRPPVIELFDPQDEKFRAWGDDRTTVDRLLALPGVRPALSMHLCGDDGVLTLRKGILAIRRSFPRSRAFDVGPDPAEAGEMVRAEWDLLMAASRLA